MRVSQKLEITTTWNNKWKFDTSINLQYTMMRKKEFDTKEIQSGYVKVDEAG